MKDIICRVKSNTQIAKDIYRLTLSLPYDFNQPILPGQFAQIKVGNGEHVLRRPVSVNSVGVFKDTVSFVYQTVGSGTAALSACREDDCLSVLMPLGNGFTEIHGDVLVIGAGIGAAPMKYLIDFYNNCRFTMVFGARSADRLFQVHGFKEKCRLSIVTDDGSCGKKAYACAEAESLIKENSFDIIVCCGPEPVLKGAQELSRKYNIPCLLSLEARMACGIGACMGCNVTVEESGKPVYRRCCKDGPVFNASEVIFDV